MNTINTLYKDLNPSFVKAWNRDVANSVGTRAVKNSLIGIVTTRKGSRPFDPEFGCDIEDALFENMSALTANTVEKSIISAIRKYEPRILRLNVEVNAQPDNNTIIVTITFSILDNPDTIEELKLQLASSR